MTLTAVIDFETTGISPGCGDRATEVAIVLLEGCQVVDRFQSLMNAGVRIPSFITQLTGITNAMVTSAPDAGQVMRDASRFVGAVPLVGDAFDFFFRSNTKNLKILRKHLDKHHPASGIIEG